MDNNYPNHTWTEEDSNKISAAYTSYGREIKCPFCQQLVTAQKKEGRKHLKKEYVDTHFFVTFICTGCKRTNTKTYKKGR